MKLFSFVGVVAVVLRTEDAANTGKIMQNDVRVDEHRIDPRHEENVPGSTPGTQSSSKASSVSPSKQIAEAAIVDSSGVVSLVAQEDPSAGSLLGATAKAGATSCTDNDRGLKSAGADSGSWRNWTCKQAAAKGYCNHGTQNKRAMQTNCRFSCDRCPTCASHQCTGGGFVKDTTKDAEDCASGTCLDAQCCKGSTMSAYVITGIVVGALVLVALLASSFIWCFTRKATGAAAATSQEQLEAV
eukprot:GEMP01032096.1.p1 GENE.GEMP01032096.1~~GEMP01032096.1.p1  ORF type:complete len:243 (+),score=44.11 GEMP01032096.1:258-986(+)